ncbi:Bardet-Biedl syndrome 1-like protein [Aphelenchoides bicaudatus]|nr:Bardet-Biedl syndrome 1-like protein [Aphelenchoides bicaudatus]
MSKTTMVSNTACIKNNFTERQRQNKWIRALHEPLAGVDTENNNGDHKLVLVDFTENAAKLILFQGLTSQIESPLSDFPAGIETLYCDPVSSSKLYQSCSNLVVQTNNSSSCLAVAAGGSVLIYRNMKPFFRFSVPQIYLHAPEIQMWERAFSHPEYPAKQLNEDLKSCLQEVELSHLTEHTHEMLAKKTDEDRQTFLDGIRNEEKPPVLSNRNQQRTDALDVMVLGAELGAVYWIDCQAFVVMDHLRLKSAPDKILNLGLYDIEFRTFIITRTGEVIIVKKTGRAAPVQSVFFMRSHPTNMVFSINQLVFSTRDNRIMFYSTRGKCLNELQIDDKIADIASFYYEPRQYRGVLVAVRNEIHLYMEMFLVDKMKLDEDVEWIKFGRMGFEDGVLLIGTVSGGLCAKIFRRTAILGEKSHHVGAPAAQTQRLNVPKRTKAFIDQSLRERDNYARLHQVYQRDLFMLKYQTIKTFAALQSGQTGLQPSRDAEPVDFNLELLGFGPTFLLTVDLSASKQLSVAKRSVIFTYDSNEYTATHKLIHLPDILYPGVPIKVSTHVKCLRPENQAPGELRVLLVRNDWKQPVFSASIQMPISELEVD